MYLGALYIGNYEIEHLNNEGLILTLCIYPLAMLKLFMILNHRSKSKYTF